MKRLKQVSIVIFAAFLCISADRFNGSVQKQGDDESQKPAILRRKVTIHLAGLKRTTSGLRKESESIFCFPFHQFWQV